MLLSLYSHAEQQLMDDISRETWDTGRLLGYGNDSAANTETVQDPNHIHHGDTFHIYAEISNKTYK
jgi:hypothetical protein